MDIQQAEFRGSFPKIQLTPNDGVPEFAFIGRSNVGKSSLINLLTQRKELAHTSNKPGKTQMLNYYQINATWYLVDLPGYGYAKVAKSKRKQFGRMIEEYLLQRESLTCTFVLVDANVPPQNIDIEFINWLGENGLPFSLVYTKTDRLKPAQLPNQIAAFEKALFEYWEALPPHFITSAVTRAGRDEILAYIAEIMASLEADTP